VDGMQTAGSPSKAATVRSWTGKCVLARLGPRRRQQLVQRQPPCICLRACRVHFDGRHTESPLTGGQGKGDAGRTGRICTMLPQEEAITTIRGHSGSDVGSAWGPADAVAFSLHTDQSPSSRSVHAARPSRGITLSAMRTGYEQQAPCAL
jgi:hypothetical protein